MKASSPNRIRPTTGISVRPGTWRWGAGFIPSPPKPRAAPTIIIPSTPRLSTPARSVTSSPVAAINSGVDAASTDRMMASASSTGHLSRREDQPKAVENERVAGEHVEQQNALKDLGDVQRYFHCDLRLFAAMKVSARKIPAINIPIGFRRPRNATMIAVKP